MAARHLLCLTASGGVPLFTRSPGQDKQLPFSVVGSLNAVQMFGSGQGAMVSSAALDRTTLAWRIFHESITLILVSGAENAGERFLHRLLESVFSAMVLLVGLDELVNIRNVERLKRDLKVSYQLVDSLLSGTELAVELTGSPDCLISPDADILQETLEAFAAAANSAFGCVLARGRVCAATERWRQLAPHEGELLARLVGSLAPASARDIPVYLPHGSPTVPHRLLTFLLLPGLDLCVLCGPQPTLQDIQSKRLVEQLWRPLVETLRGCAALAPHALLPPTPFHSGILGILFINTEVRRSLFTVQPHVSEDGDGGSSRAVPAERRRRLLKSFYKFAITNYFSPGPEGTAGAGGPGGAGGAAGGPGGAPAGTACTETAPPLAEDLPGGLAHRAIECYLLASGGHRCYGQQAPPRQLFLLLGGGVPGTAMRSISRAVMQTLSQLL